MKNKGFTLVELLIAVAIIGILTAIALVSLSNARMAAKDAAVRQALNNYRTQIEIEYEGNYNGLCTNGNPSLNNIEGFIESQGGSLYSCDSNTSDYVIVATLPSGEDANLGYLGVEQAYAQRLSAGGLSTDTKTLNGSAIKKTTKHDALCINSRGNLIPIYIDEYNELPKRINLNQTPVVKDVETPKQRIQKKVSATINLRTLTLNPFCNLTQMDAYFNGGQNGTTYARVCYDLENPEYTKTGCVDVLEKTPVDPVFCDRAGIEPLTCPGDFDDSLYQNVCPSKLFPTGCAENDPKSGQPAVSVDPVFCKGLEPANCGEIKLGAHCIDKVFNTGCVELDTKGNPAKPADPKLCVSQGIKPSAEICSTSGLAAHCIDKVFNTGCVELDTKGNPAKPADPKLCVSQGIKPSAEICSTSGLAAHCIDKVFNTGCVELDGKGNPMKPVGVDSCLHEGITPSKELCPGAYMYVCIGKEPPYQTGCVENKDGKLFQVDPKLCEEAKATPARCK